MNSFISNYRVSWLKKGDTNQLSGIGPVWKMISSQKDGERVFKMRAMPTNTKAEELAQKDKKKILNAFMNAVFEGGTTKNHIKEPAQIFIADIDLNGNPDLSIDNAFTTFQKLPHVVAIGTSIRGGGVYVIIRIEPTMLDEDFKTIFYSIEADFKKLGYEIDRGCKDICRKRFFGYSDRNWFNPNEPTVYTPNVVNEPKNRPQAAIETNANVSKDVEDLIKEIEANSIDIVPNYDEYFDLALSFVNEYKEGGRGLFHRACSSSPKYDYNDAERKFDSALKSTEGKHSISTFYYFCKLAGLQLTDWQAISAKNAERNRILNKVHTSGGVPTIKRDLQLYPSYWDAPCERNEVNDYWRYANWACDLEAAKVSRDFDKGDKILAEMQTKGFNQMPEDILQRYAPTLFNQMQLTT